jgi:hypothetical protein
LCSLWSGHTQRKAGHDYGCGLPPGK